MKVPGHRSSQPSLSVGIRISPTSAPHPTQVLPSHFPLASITPPFLVLLL